MKKALKFAGLPDGTHTWYEDDTQAIEPSGDDPGYPGPVIRVNPGDVVPVDRFHKAGHFSAVNVAENFIERGIAVLVDLPDEKTAPAAKVAPAVKDESKN